MKYFLTFRCVLTLASFLIPFPFTARPFGLNGSNFPDARASENLDSSFALPDIFPAPPMRQDPSIRFLIPASCSTRSGMAQVPPT